MYPNRSTCRQIQDFVAGYKIHVARYIIQDTRRIHVAGNMYPATCRQCVPGFSGNALVSINVVTLRWARLVPGWVTIFGRVNYLRMYNQPPRSTQPPSGVWPSFALLTKLIINGESVRH